MAKKLTSTVMLLCAGVVFGGAICGCLPVQLQDQGETGFPVLNGDTQNGDGNQVVNQFPFFPQGNIPVFTTREGMIVTLNTPANDLDGDPLTYGWQQLTGAPVLNVTGVGTPTVMFEVPQIETNSVADATMTFRITVDDGKGGVVTLDVTAVVLMGGDANGDNVVDETDKTLVEGFFGDGGLPGPNGEGDLNGDGIVDLQDLTLVLEQLGRTLN